MSFNRNKNHVNIMFERLLRKQAAVVKKAEELSEGGRDFEFSSRKSKVAFKVACSFSSFRNSWHNLCGFLKSAHFTRAATW